MTALPGRHPRPHPRDVPAGIVIGKVTRVTADGAYLRIDELARGFEYGPAAYPDLYRAGVDLDEDVTGDTAVGDHGTHHHAITRALAPLTGGDTVLVAFTGDGDPVIVARL